MRLPKKRIIQGEKNVQDILFQVKEEEPAKEVKE